MLSVKNINKKYGETEALRDVHLEIPSGVCYGLIGPNGSGKSTLMKIISKIIKQYRGEIEFDSNRFKTLGYVPQDISLEEKLNANTNLKFFGEIHRIKGANLKNKSQELLQYVGLEDWGQEKVETFSGGMKRRLNIGCAIIQNPDLIIMDEPTVGVDPQSRRHIFNIVNRLKAEGKTIIYVSHYMEEIEFLCDHVAFINNGSIIEEGKIGDILSKYQEHSVFINGESLEPIFENVDFTFEKYKDGWKTEASDPMNKIEEIARLCTEKNLQPTQLSLTNTRLEDIFFSLTGADLKDQT